MRAPTTLVVDVANVMGSRPDGWWRDRVAAARRQLDGLCRLPGLDIPGPDGQVLTVGEVVAVVEGRAREVEDPDVPGLTVVRARRDGDTAIVEVAGRRTADGDALVVVTADRGLRARLPDGCLVAGPRWLLSRTAVVADDPPPGTT